MKCPKCKRELGELKKYEYVNCKCGEQVMCIKNAKKLVLVKLGVDTTRNRRDIDENIKTVEKVN